MRASQLLTIPLRSATWLLVASAGAVLAACSDGDGTGPARAGSVRAAAYGAQAETTDTAYVPDSAPARPRPAEPVRFASWAPPLETYDTSFTLVQGVASADTIFFQQQPGAPEREMFMVLAIPGTATFVDSAGGPLAAGSTVQLTVKVDRNFVQLDFGPHGSTFTQEPALLYVWWHYAELLGRRGRDLKLWYQPDQNTPWAPLETEVSTTQSWVVAPLYHFSNYAVAF